MLSLVRVLLSIMPWAYAETLPVEATASLSQSFEQLQQLNTHFVDYSNQNCSQETIAGGIPTDAYPEVVQIEMRPQTWGAACTGTLIGPGTLLTAAHCLGCAQGRAGNLKASFNFNGTPIHAKSYICHPAYAPSKTNNSWTGVDLAFILFDPDKIAIPPTYPKIKKISYQRDDKNGGFVVSAPDKTVQLVGYGVTGPILRDNGVKRMGQARLTTYVEMPQSDGALNGGIFYTQGWSSSLVVMMNNSMAKGVAIQPGDSGGPLYHQGSIIGVASAGASGIDPKLSFSHHTDLSSPAAIAFLLGAKQVGAKFTWAP